MKMRIFLLGLAALGLAGLTQCTDDEVWILPVTPTAPVSPVGLNVPVSPVTRGFSFSLAKEVRSADEVRVVELAPRWDGSPLEPGDLVLFECELRPGGGGAAVDSRQFSLEYGQDRELRWNVEKLEPGWWEVFCRPSARGRAVVELISTEGQDCARGCGFAFLERWEQE